MKHALLVKLSAEDLAVFLHLIQLLNKVVDCCHTTLCLDSWWFDVKFSEVVLDDILVVVCLMIVPIPHDLKHRVGTVRGCAPNKVQKAKDLQLRRTSQELTYAGVLIIGSKVNTKVVYSFVVLLEKVLAKENDTALLLEVSAVFVHYFESGNAMVVQQVLRRRPLKRHGQGIFCHLVHLARSEL